MWKQTKGKIISNKNDDFEVKMIQKLFFVIKNGFGNEEFC